jgi:hypothetical protein
MRTIIAGSRSITDYRAVCDAVTESCFDITTVVSGTARGVDKLGERWARAHGVPVDRYPAQWDRDGKAAGYKRNTVMAILADALIALWDGKSRGTKHMIDEATRRGLRVFVYRT